MDYIPASAARYGRVSQAQGLALVLPLSKTSEAFLVTSGERSVSIFLSGDHAGHVIQTENASNFDGMIIEGVEIEVDLSSAYNPSEASKRARSVVRQSTVTGVFVVDRADGFNQTVIAPLDEISAPSSASERVAFTRWRITVGTGDEKVVLREIDAEAN